MNLNTGPGWTPARVAQLEELHAQGLSCEQIAKALGYVTRNAVIGKLARLGLGGPPRAARETNAVRERNRDGGVINMGKVRAVAAARAAKPAPIKIPKAPPRPQARDDDGALLPDNRPLRVVQTPGRFVTLAELNPHECRYPTDDPGPGEMHRTIFCGAVAGDETYCPTHKALCSAGAPKEKKAGRMPGDDIYDGMKRQRRYA